MIMKPIEQRECKTTTFLLSSRVKKLGDWTPFSAEQVLRVRNRMKLELLQFKSAF